MNGLPNGLIIGIGLTQIMLPGIMISGLLF